MRRKLLSIHVAAALAATLGSTAAFAQPAQPAAHGGLEELVVTARKREESLQDAPVTVSVVSQERIQKYDVTSLERIAQITPQFYVGRASNGSGAQLSMRGIGSSSTSIGLEQSVAVVLDNVYYGQGRVLNEGMFDMQQIELLKGPQALFFGKNATAGVVSLTTAKPTEEFEAMVRAGYEFEGDEIRTEGFVSGPITDTIGARLALRYTDMSGSLFDNKATVQQWTRFDTGTGQVLSPLVVPVNDDDAPGGSDKLARLSFSFDPSEDLSATLSISSSNSRLDNSSFNYTHFNCPGGVSGGTAGFKCGDDFTIAQNNMPAEMAASLPYADKDGDLYNKYKSWSVTNNIEYTFGSWMLTSTLNFQQNKNSWACACDYQSWTNGVFATENSKWDAWSEELRLSSDFDGPLNVMAGVLYQETERDFRQWVAFAGVVDSTTTPENFYIAQSKDSSTDGETLSPFIQLIYKPREDIELSVGGRYTDEKKESTFIHPFVNAAVRPIWRMQELAAADQKFTEWSPEATLKWDVSDDTTAYIAYKNGYKSGGFSNSGIYSSAALGGSIDDFTFDPETAEGFEVGIKSTLLDNQLRLSLTAYSYDYEDLQVDFFNAPVFQFITLNAGKAQSRGWEAEGEYAPMAVEGLTLRGSVAYNVTEYDEFVSPCWTGMTAAQGCNVPIPGTSAIGQDISGEPTAMAPEWTASFGIAYDRDIGSGMRFGVALDGMYSDEYNASGFANPHAMIDSYTMLHANAYISGMDDKWQLMLMGKNLTDEQVISGVVDGPSTGVPGSFSDQMGFTSNPRTVALQLTVRFR